MVFIAHKGDAQYYQNAWYAERLLLEVIEEVRSDYPHTSKRLDKLRWMLGEFNKDINFDGTHVELRVYTVAQMPWEKLYNIVYTFTR